MSLRMVWIVGVVFIVMLVGVVWARALGRLLPASPTYLETGFCEQPCWQGLRPGVDNVNQFLYQVRNASPYSGRTSDPGDGVVRMFELSTFGALTLADVVREFGPPDRVGCLGLDHTSMYPGQTLVTAADLYFGGGYVEVNAVRQDQDMRLSPGMQVRWIRYYAPDEEPVYPIGATTGWHGFASRYRECHP